jgi:hypothetical protein
VTGFAEPLGRPSQRPTGDSRSNTAMCIRRRPALSQSASCTSDNRSANNASEDVKRGSLDAPHGESGENGDDD